jgi:hypothetical protein
MRKQFNAHQRYLARRHENRFQGMDTIRPNYIFVWRKPECFGINSFGWRLMVGFDVFYGDERSHGTDFGFSESG